MKKCILALVLALTLLFSCCLADSFLPTLEVEGTTYTARPSAETESVLLIGYDHVDNGELMPEFTEYHLGGQSDFLLLLVFDHAKKEIHQLQISRDIMTQIRLVHTNGAVSLSPSDLQICLAHAYGVNQEDTNANTIWAVENLLGIAGENDGAGIDWYISMDISGIARLNDLLGGVTVTVADDDLAELDPELTAGAPVKLTGRQAETFVRARMGAVHKTNDYRMARQRLYMNSAQKLFRQKLAEDRNFAKTILDGMGIKYDRSKRLSDDFGFSTQDDTGTMFTDTPTHYLMSNATVDQLVALTARSLDYEVQPVTTLPGRLIVGNTGHYEFYPLEGSAMSWALAMYYTAE